MCVRVGVAPMLSASQDCDTVPDLFGLAGVVQKEEDVCILADAVVSKALQIDEEVV